MIDKDFVVFNFLYCLSIRSGINVINNPKLKSMKILQGSRWNRKTVTGVGVKKILVLFDSKLQTIINNLSLRIKVSLDGKVLHMINPSHLFAIFIAPQISM